MTKLALKAAAIAIVCTSFASQGCALLQWGKYNKLKREHEQALRDLDGKDSLLSNSQTRLQALRDQMVAKDQLIKLYEDKYGEAKDLYAATKKKIDELQAELDKRMADFAKGRPGVVFEHGLLRISNTLLFALGSADISEDGQALLADFAREFQAATDIIRIDGHTDDHKVSKPATIEKFEDNWGLSSERALAVLRILTRNGIPERRVYARAFSMTRPRVPNTSEDNRSKNRRVDIALVPAAIPAAPAAGTPE